MQSGKKNIVTMFIVAAVAVIVISSIYILSVPKQISKSADKSTSPPLNPLSGTSNIMAISSDMLTKFPELLTYAQGADQQYNKYLALCATGYCNSSLPITVSNSYTTTISADEAKLLLASFPFQDTNVPNTSQSWHSTILSINGHNYGIIISGI